MIKKLASHLGEYKRAAILTPMFSALEAVMDILLPTIMAVSYTHLRAHETDSYLVCRLLLEKKKK